jgi:CheY-like chemotaxis protein
MSHASISKVSLKPTVAKVSPKPTMPRETKSSGHIAGLRHQLLTPLHHIIGYADLLLDESPDLAYSSVYQNLTRIRETARQLVRMIHTHLGPNASPRGDKLAEKSVADLRWDFAAPLHSILQAVGAITSENTTAVDANDILRIGRAATELLAFVDGANATPAAATIAHSSGAAHTVHPDAGGGRILIVDDNAENRDLLARFLKRRGHQVTEVSSGAEALERLVESSRDGHDKPYEVVLLDMLMPKLDGFQVLERIKADPALRSIPVIIVSALDEVPGVARCLEIGAEDYLFKPVDPGLLSARVSSALEGARLRDRERRHSADLERAYKRIQLSEDRLRLMLAADHAGVWEWDLAEGSKERSRRGSKHANGGSFKGLDQALASIHPEDRERVQRKLMESVQQSRDFHEELRLLRPDGSVGWVELLGTLNLDSERRPIGMIGVVRDISRRKRLEIPERPAGRRGPRG